MRTLHTSEISNSYLGPKLGDHVSLWVQQDERSLVIEQCFLLMDEPFSGIDPIQVLELQRIIFDLKNAGIGVLVTDHNVRETLAVTDRAYIINNGKIFRAGTPEALGNDSEVRRVDLGENLHLEFQTRAR